MSKRVKQENRVGNREDRERLSSQRQGLNGPEDLEPWRTGNLYKLVPPLLVLGLAALFGGGHHPWVLSACVAIAAAALLVNKPPIRISLRYFWWIGMAYLLWHSLTLSTLPVSVLGRTRHDLFQTAHEQLAELHAVRTGRAELAEWRFVDSRPASPGSGWADGGMRGYGRPTLNQAGTRRFILIVAGAWAMFWLTTAMTLSQRLRLMAMVVLGGAVFALLGLLGIYLSSSGNPFWWFLGNAGQDILAARRQFAFLCAVLTPVALSMIVSPVPMLDLRPAGSGGRERRRDRQKAAAAPSSSDGYGWSWLPSWWTGLSRDQQWRLVYALGLVVLMIAAVLAWFGAAAMVVLSCSIVVLVWLKGRPAPALAGMVVVLGLLLFFLVWPSQTVQRGVSSLGLWPEQEVSRNVHVRESVRQWGDFVLIGGGAESFRTLNSLYRNRAATDSPVCSGSEYLQLPADHGFLGTVLTLAVVVALGIGFWSNFHSRFQRMRSWRLLHGIWGGQEKVVKRQQELYSPIVSLAVIAAATGVVVGIFFNVAYDCSIRLPLNGFLAAALLGLAMPLPKKVTSERSRYWRWPLSFFLIFSLIILVSWSGSKILLDEPAYLAGAEVDTLTRAVAAAPSYWLAWWHLSERLLQKAESIPPDDLDQIDPVLVRRRGLECLQVAASLNPQNPMLWRTLAEAGLRSGERTRERILADLERAARLSPRNYDYWRAWLDQAFAAPASEDAWKVAETALTKAGRRVAIQVWQDLAHWAEREENQRYQYRAALLLAEMQPRQEQWQQWRDSLRGQPFQLEEDLRFRQTLTELQPENWRNWMELGKLWLEMEEPREAERAFARVLQLRPQMRREVTQILNDNQGDEDDDETTDP